MSWPRSSLKHRYLVYTALIATVVLGTTARFNLPVQLFPDTDPPVVTVIISYPGVSATDVARTLSKPVEEELSSIDGIVHTSTTSQTGLAVVKAEFDYVREVGDAAVDVQNALARIRGDLPGGIAEPQVLEFSSSDKPIMTLGLRGMGLSLNEVRELADNTIRDRIQRVPGVAAVDVFGGHKKQLEVSVSRERLLAYQTDMASVQRVLAGWNLSAAGGRVDWGDQEAVIRFEMPIENAEGVSRLVLFRSLDREVLIGDVAEIRLVSKEARSAYRLNGHESIAVQILKREDANTVEVAANVRAEIERISADLPQVACEIADDDSVFTVLVMSNMTSTVLLAIALTIFVVFLFLAHLRKAAIIALSIPVSFLMTFAMMQVAGIELHMVTMSAIILSVGLLVDDGIVVLENVSRHLRDLGKSPFRAAVEGTEEIFLADLAGSLTTICVLVPMMFLGGFVGKLFGPLAWTLTFALTASFLVSVTMIPLLSALWLRPEDSGSKTTLRWVAPVHRALDLGLELYLSLLRWATARPWRTLAVALALLVASMRLFAFLGSEMLPKFDAASFQVQIDTAPGTRLEDTLAAVGAAEEILLAESGVLTVSTQVGYEPGGRYLGSRGAMDANQAEITVNLSSRKDRESTIWQIMDRARARIAGIPGITLYTLQEKGGTAKATTKAPIDVQVSGPDAAILDQIGDQVLDEIRDIPGLVGLSKSWTRDTPEITVTLDRRRAAEMGLTGADIAHQVFSAMEGRVVTPLRQSPNRDLDVYLRYAEGDRENPSDLEDIVIQGPRGEPLPLREVATLERHVGPRLLTREDQVQTQDILGHQRGVSLSRIVSAIQQRLERIDLPEGYEVTITGEQRDFEEARGRMLRALLLGIVAVYLVLVAQFRSFKHPLTIMMAVPLQFVGVSLALLLAGKSVSMPALLGIILLTGTVVNNSIVLIDYILQRRSEGATLEQAIVDAVTTRYRPIMMTAFSDIAGMLPLAFELAVGSERFSPIATVVIGGILAATLLTLVVIPVIFSLLERLFPSTSEDPFLELEVQGAP